MKKHTTAFLFFLFLAATNVYGQEKVEKFCQVVTRFKSGFSSKRVAAISFGEQPALFNFKDSSVITALLKVNELTAEPDVLNYMSSIGWKFVAFQFPGQFAPAGIFYFKREFDKSELAGE